MNALQGMFNIVAPLTGALSLIMALGARDQNNSLMFGLTGAAAMIAWWVLGT